MTPRFKHDCENCTFFGRDGKYDTYFCHNKEEGTVIARFGDDPGDYASASVSHALYSSFTDPKEREKLRGEPYEAYTQLAKRLLSDGVVRLSVDRIAILKHQLRAKNVETWDEIYEAFLNITTLTGDGHDQRELAQKAYGEAEKFCKEECLAFLIPKPSKYEGKAEAERRLASAIMGPITKG